MTVEKEAKFYICPTCFSTSGLPAICHDQPMIACRPADLDDCRPLQDAEGNLKTRAPKWFVDGAAKREQSSAES